MSRLQLLLRRYGTAPTAWTEPISQLLGSRLDVTAIKPIGRQGSKAHGMTQSLEITARDSFGGMRRYFLKIPDESLYGETLAADCLRDLAWRREGYEDLPGHVRCLGMGSISEDGAVRACISSGEPHFAIEEGIDGHPYFEALAALAQADDPADAVREAETICRHLVTLHRPLVGDQTSVYLRALRDNLMVPVFRLIDGGAQRWGKLAKERTLVEHAFVDWRIRLAGAHHRLRRVHQDFHPWNVFLVNNGVRTIGARLPGWGDPADDVACFTSNYLWFGMRAPRGFAGPYLDAFKAFRDTYILLSGDGGIAEVFAPYFAKRLLVFLNPTYYPDVTPQTVNQLLLLLVAVLQQDADILTEPERVARVIEGARVRSGRNARDCS